MAFLSATLVGNQQATLTGLRGGQLKAGSGRALRLCACWGICPSAVYSLEKPCSAYPDMLRYASAPFTGCTIIGELNQISVDRARPRAAFFLSDRAGSTVEMLGHSLLRQFEDVPFEEITLPYLNTSQEGGGPGGADHCPDQAGRPTTVCVQYHCESGNSTRVDSAMALHLDCFCIFIAPIEAELGRPLFSLRWAFSPCRRTTDHYQHIEDAVCAGA